jgi:hypothetical protein
VTSFCSCCCTQLLSRSRLRLRRKGASHRRRHQRHRSKTNQHDAIVNTWRSQTVHICVAQPDCQSNFSHLLQLKSALLIHSKKRGTLSSVKITHLKSEAGRHNAAKKRPCFSSLSIYTFKHTQFHSHTKHTRLSLPSGNASVLVTCIVQLYQISQHSPYSSR